MRTRVCSIFTFLVIFQGLSSSAYSQDSSFATVSLPYGVKVEVPKNWWLISGDLNTTIEAGGEAAVNLAGIEVPSGRKVNLLRANSMPKTTYAGIAINASDSDYSEADIRAAGKAELVDMAPKLRDALTRSLSQGNLSVIDFYPIEKTEIGGHPALLVSYKRSGPQGPVIVRMTRLIINSKEISLNLSYRESETVLWKAIIGYMEKSLRIDK